VPHGNVRVRWFALTVWAAATMAFGYEGPMPRYIVAEVTWKDPKTGQERTDEGQLWFSDLPIINEKGQVGGFGKMGYYNGIKWFVPKNPGDIWIARSPNATNVHVVTLHDHFGERGIVLAFDRIDVMRTDDSKLHRMLDDNVGDIAEGIHRTGTSAAPMTLQEGDADEDAPILTTTPTAPGKAPPPPGPKKKGVAEPVEPPSPLRFATAKDIGVKAIPLGDLIRISFRTASDGLKREAYGGRYVQYSNQACGDDGRVQVAAATFFGGTNGDERFVYGDFLKDGSILLAGNFYDLGFTDPKLTKLVGTDPAPDAYPPIERSDPRRNRRWTEYPRRTIALMRYSADLRNLTGIVRLPWGVGTAWEFHVGPDDALYVSGQVGPHFDAFAGSVSKKAMVENPEAAAEAKNRRREPGPDGFVVKIEPDHRTVGWLVRFQHAGADIFPRPDGQVLTRRGTNLFFVGTDGSVNPGPALDIAGSHMAVDPRNGDMYFGGSYRSGTGLEPYVCPYLYKLDKDGKQVWTAYGWTGPIVGVAQQRLVSDSSVTGIRVGEDGSITIRGWSDGGNTVLGCQPYDMRKDAPSSGFASSLWGATGGLTVRIAHIVHMSGKTMEVDHCTKYVGYIPTSDIPTLINIYDMTPMANGDVAITGGGWLGFIESYDAWITSWYVEHRTNEFAQAKGGPFFTLFPPDFSKPRISTITPGASGLRLASRGKWALLYGGATDLKPTDADRPWARRFRTIIRNAVQPENGGGLDAYAILVDTQGPRQPPAIPEKTWGEPLKDRKR
jgi:hypothetical protein